MTSRSHIPPVTKHTDVGSRGKGKLNIFVLNSHNKLQIMLIKNKIFLRKRRTVAFWQKTRHFGKITAFGENRDFHDFHVSVIIYCL